MVATPLVDTRGPLAAYGEVNKALQEEGVFDDVPHRRIFLKSPNDRTLKVLEKESRAIPQETFRVVNEQIAGTFVEDAYVYSGSLDIAEFENSPRGASSTYYVAYVPYSGLGDTAVRVNSLGNLRKLLLSDLHINQGVVDSTLKELSERKRVLIPSLRLRARDLKRLRPV